MHELDGQIGVPDTLHQGRYVIGARLGAGGMATVHQCVDVALDVRRAIKLRHRMGGRHEAVALQRLADEARIMARLDHPRVLPVYDIGQEGDWHYVVMELAVGGSLTDRLDAEGAIAPRLAVDWMVDVLHAVDAAHSHGIVHRDIKPQNILLDDQSRPWLADWGIARMDDRDQTLTRTHVGMGSMSYMAPEQRQDAHGVGPAADIYAVGATLYHLVTTETSVDLFHARPSSPRWDAVPVPLQPILQRACALKLGDRYPDAASMISDLMAVRDRLSATPVVAARAVEPSDGGTLTAVPDAPPAEQDEAASLAVGAGPPWTVMVAMGAVGVAAVAIVALAVFPLGLVSPPPASLEMPVSTSPVGTPAAPAGASVAAAEPGDDAPSDDEAAPVPPEEPGSQEPAADEAGSPPLVNGGSAVDASGDSTSGARDEPTSSPGAAAPDGPGADAAGTSEDTPAMTVARLPVHGPWRGSLDGNVARLSLDGPTDQLTGWLTLSGERGRVTGHYDAEASTLVLQVAGPGIAAGSWTLGFDEVSLDGRVARSGSADVLPVHLSRSPSP